MYVTLSAGCFVCFCLFLCLHVIVGVSRSCFVLFCLFSDGKNGDHFSE